MNFNLISDPNNGYDFQTRFREDIHIKKNSRAYLNFAQLSKLNSINLTQDQTIRLLSTDLYPRYNNNLTPAQISQEVSIPKGTYNLQQFQKIIQSAIQKIIDESPQLYYYSTEFDAIDPTAQKNFVIGCFLEDSSQWENVDFINDPDNTFGMEFDGDINGFTKSTPTSAIIQYDCFAISDKYYYHHFIDDNQQSINSNMIFLESSHNIEDLEGNISFGLVSTEFKAINDTDTNVYLGGNTEFNPSFLASTGAKPATNPPVWTYSIKSFLSVDFYIERSVIAGPNPGDPTGNIFLNIYQPRLNNNTDSIKLKDMDFESAFTNRLAVKRINIRNKYATLNQPLLVALQTYIPSTNTQYKTNERKVYFRVFLMTDGSQINFEDDCVYDSMEDGIYFPYAFFNTYPTPEDANQNGSSIPFKIFLSAQEEGEGWKNIKYKAFDKSTDTETTSRSIMNSYKLQFSAQLSEYLENDAIRDATIGPLFPNVSESQINNPSFFHSTNLSLDFLNDSYSIIIEELPLKSYKNTEIQANGGYSQHILANLPCPFTTNFNNTTKDTNLISTVFTPSFQSYIEMKNQDFKTNHLRVKIMNMRTNYPATELKQSTINFTIEETEESK